MKKNYFFTLLLTLTVSLFSFGQSAIITGYLDSTCSSQAGRTLEIYVDGTIDFTGWACVNCREVEEKIWPDKEVFKLIEENYILASLYVDEDIELPADQQGEVDITYDNGNVKKKKIRTTGDKWFTFETLVFKNNAQPRYILVSPEGVLLNNPISYSDIKKGGGAKFYADFLRCGIDAYNKIKQHFRSCR